MEIRPFCVYVHLRPLKELIRKFEHIQQMRLEFLDLTLRLLHLTTAPRPRDNG